MRTGTFKTTLAISSAAIAIGMAQPTHAQQQTQERQQIKELTKEVEELKAIVYQLQKQVAKNAAQAKHVAAVSPTQPHKATAHKLAVAQASSAPPPNAPAPQQANPAPVPPPAAPAPTPAATAETTQGPASSAKSVVADLLRGITINGALDVYYEYNTNHPIGRINYLRAYDVSSDNFSLNQADLILESAPDPANDKPFGMRFDLQYGQATATLQGNPANELRPEVYRPVYQAYGTYIVPLGNGVDIDFGKWASSLGMEGNYAKDQLNYSRSFWFDYLPFYHMGLRVKYPVNDVLTLQFWVTNGTQQTEAFNNYKDQLYGVVLTPTSDLTWTFNYYRGQEHPDVIYVQSPGPGQQNLPQQQGTYIEPITNPPTGMLNIGDTYASWQATPELTLGAEADYVIERDYSYSPPQRTYGGALYAGYQITPKLDIAARTEYMADHGGLFSGVKQDIKEGTFTLDYRPAGDGFLVDLEYRRDWSNTPYFLSSTLGVLEKNQPTIGVGVVWWFGQKQGAW